jgi:hypothetical protein
MFAGLGLLLMALGWPMASRRVRPNRWYGLRIPATFADERVWYEANALSGRDLMALGALVLVLALVLPRVAGLPSELSALACSGVLGAGALILTVRGWRFANRLLRERRGGG